MDWFGFLAGNAQRFGLNLIAAIAAERYDAGAGPAYRAGPISRDCRSIVVIGNGGADFWRAFKAHAAVNSGWLERRDPLDDFTRQVIEQEIVRPIQALGRRCTAVYPFGNGPTLNFMQLAILAGLASPSI